MATRLGKITTARGKNFQSSVAIHFPLTMGDVVVPVVTSTAFAIDDGCFCECLKLGQLDIRRSACIKWEGKKNNNNKIKLAVFQSIIKRKKL